MSSLRTVTISDGTTTLRPLLWMEYASSRDARTRVHALMGGGIAATLAPHGPRVVVVQTLWDDEAESLACEQMHATPRVLTITDPDRHTHEMQYIVTGRVERTLDTATREMWTVTAEVTEAGAA